LAQLDVEAVDLYLEDLPKLENLTVSEWDARTMSVFGLKPVEALADSMRDSAETLAIFVDDELVAIWGHGFTDFIAGIGYVWLITTPAISQYKFRFALNSYRIVEHLMTVYSLLKVVVDAEFLQSVDWLKRMGFQLHPSAVIKHGHPFLFMWKER
jgi:hypothetical protein